MGEPKPPMPLPQPMASRIGAAVFASVSPPLTNFSMAAATGQRMAATTTFGRNTDSTTDAPSHAKICCFIEVPIPDSALTATRLSRPVRLHVRQIRSAPSSSTTISEKYWLMTSPFGISVSAAFTAIGSSAVTAIATGRSAHQSAIHTAIPSAPAAAAPKDCAAKYTTRNAVGPDKSAVCFFIAISLESTSLPSLYPGRCQIANCKNSIYTTGKKL